MREEKGKTQSVRMCVGCRVMKPKNELIRVVKSPEGQISLDETGKKDGRGAYICRSKECFQLAVKRRAFERAFKGQLPNDVTARLESEFIDG